MPASLPKSDSRSYWAAEPDSKRAAANVVERIRRYRKWLKETGRAARMQRGFNTFYGHAPAGDGDASQVSQSGEQGEWVDVTTNSYAMLVTQSVVRTTGNKPAFKAIATNADSASLEQADFAQGLLEYASNTHSIADRDYEMVMIGDICSEGWQVHGWDASAGKNLTDFVPGEATREGDIKVRATTPFRVAYDPDCEDSDSFKWFAFKARYNRFDLAKGVEGKDPDAAEKLRAMSGDMPREWEDNADELDLGGSVNGDVSSDLVWVWEFRHMPTESLPNGRLLRFVDSECAVYDSFEVVQDEATGEASLKDHGYPYAELHAYRYCPQNIIGSVAGHTPSFDLLGLQELKDTLATQMMTAANAGGVSNLWHREGDKPVVTSVVGAMNFLQSQTKPEPLEGVQLSDQVPAAGEFVDREMMHRMGESDVSMGDVPKGMPGNLAALLEAKTVQYHSRGQASYAHVLERSRTGMLRMYKRFAKSDRVAVLGGIANGYEHKTWSATDLTGVDRFVVESVNPLTQTYSGNMEAAKELLEHGMIDDPKQYLLLRSTGRMEPALQSAQAMLMGIRKEKEMILKGVGLAPVDPAQSFAKGLPVFVDDGQPHIQPLIYDKHWEYILEDLGVIAAPLVRQNGKIAEAAMGVVEERLRLMKKVDPVMLAVLKYPPEIAQAIMMAQMPMVPPGAVPPGPPNDHNASKPSKLPETPGLPNGAPRIAAARPPKDPITGAQAPSPVASGGIQ